MTEEQRAHQSENELDNFENFDYTIINRQNEFDEFFKKIHYFNPMHGAHGLWQGKSRESLSAFLYLI